MVFRRVHVGFGEASDRCGRSCCGGWFRQPGRGAILPVGYGYNKGGVVGAIINGVLGGGQYRYGNQYGYSQSGDRYAVGRCCRAVQARLGGGYGVGGYGY